MKVCTFCTHKTDQPLIKGSGWIELVLWICYIVPGLIYSIWRRGESNRCPNCKTDNLIPVFDKKITNKSILHKDDSRKMTIALLFYLQRHKIPSLLLSR